MKRTFAKVIKCIILLLKACPSGNINVAFKKAVLRWPSTLGKGNMGLNFYVCISTVKIWWQRFKTPNEDILRTVDL